MKRLFLLALCAIMLSVPAFAAGSSVVEGSINYLPSSSNANMITVSFTATGDDATGAIPATAFSAALRSALKGYYLYAMETNPGATGPTDDYDITLVDADALDILGAAGMDRDKSATELVMPKIGTTDTFIPIDGGELTLTFANTSVNSATIVVKFYFVR